MSLLSIAVLFVANGSLRTKRPMKTFTNPPLRPEAKITVFIYGFLSLTCEPHSEGGIRFPKGKIDGEGGPPLVH